MIRALTVLAWLVPSIALAQSAPVRGGATHQMMHHHPAGASVPTQPGQAAFAAIQEIVGMLEADPQTDWSKVNIEALRQHLIDMNNVTLEAKVTSEPVDGGMRFDVTGEGPVRDSIRRMVMAHAATMNGVDVRNREIDCVLVWKFDRFARSTRHLLAALEEFDHLGVRFISVQDQIDTDSPMGRAMFTIIGAMAELESSLISERVTAGMKAAETRGRHLGRPPIVQCIVSEIEALAASTDLSVRQIQLRRMASGQPPSARKACALLWPDRLACCADRSWRVDYL